MKKKTVANLIMVMIILIIAAAGVLGVGTLQGWFDKADETVAVLTDVRGVVNLERSGAVFPVESDTVLRSGDQLTAGSGATAVIRIGDDYLTLGSMAQLAITDPTAGNFCASVSAGELFVNTGTAVTLFLDEWQTQYEDTVAAISVRSGCQSVSVFSGTVADANAGQLVERIHEEVTVSQLKLASLNDFVSGQVRIANESTVLCFTNEDLDQLAADRQQALQDLINSLTKPPQSDVTEPSQPDETESTQPTETEPSVPAATQPPSTEPAQTEPTQPQPPATVPGTEYDGSCYITVLCNTILDNMNSLNPGKAEFVPDDGIILPLVEVPYREGETVFDILKRVCEISGIQLEYSWSPLYDSYYIEGINNLYEKDCGIDSGWMYKVNEWFPNYGCSSYKVSDGNVIVFCYTCQGYGSDVGAPEW